MMRALAATGLAAVALSVLPALPAQAATAVSVTSPSCGTLRISNPSTSTYTVMFDSSDIVDVPGGSTQTLSNQPGGDYTWIQGTPDGGPVAGVNLVRVATCAGAASRPVDGDQNGDGLADVLGIQVNTGDLYYYRMTSTGLAPGIKAGTGWDPMVFMQQVNEIEGSMTPNYLLAVRNDGTLWRYDNKGSGRFSNGRQIGSGLSGYDNFTISQVTNPFTYGGHSLFARKGDSLYYWDLTATGIDGPYSIDPGWGTTVRTIATRDFNGDHAGDFVTIRSDGTMWAYTVDDSPTATTMFKTPKQVGSGWGGMQTVTSPGSLNGDRLSDLVARRGDGNLYKYINAGGRWSPAVQIGHNWNAIRLLA